MNDIGISVFDQMRKNRWRTAYLFIIFPIIILGLTYIGFLIFGLNVEIDGEKISPITLANEMMQTVGFWIILGVFCWSLISYFFGSKMIMAFAGAKPLQKRANPQLYRVVENASITAGLPKTPEIYIINDESMNAFATGTSPTNSKVAISKGLLKKLDKSELEGVMAHEIGHILNRDIRVMLLAITLVGAIEMVGEILIRTRSSGSNKKGNPLILIGLLFLTLGVLLGTLTRLAISREREYLADATSAHITSNPHALASALKKIASDARLEVLDKKASMAGLCTAHPTQKGHIKHKKSLKGIQQKQKSGIVAYWYKIWSTHPSITTRINRLHRY